MRTGFYRRAKPQSGLDRISGIRRLVKQRFQILSAADCGHMDALAVYGELDLMRRFKAADNVQIGSIQLCFKRVIAVEREVMPRARSTDGPQGHTLEML